ncbi:MAG: ABC transporter ATP-binding protein [Ilumatobacteraceae bacterium]
MASSPSTATTSGPCPARRPAGASPPSSRNPTRDSTSPSPSCVALGRIPHRHGWQRLTAGDHGIVEQAIERVGLAGFETRHVATLSGGERQRANIARAVAQQAQVLVLDEPTNHLDVRHQLEILELVTSLGVTVIAALHDLTLADRYADQVLLLARGRLLDCGTPRQTITADNIHRLLGVHARFLPDPASGQRAIVFDLPAGAHG